MTEEILKKGNILMEEKENLSHLYSYINELRDTISDDTIILLNILKKENFRKTLKQFLEDTSIELISHINIRGDKVRKEFEKL